MGGGAWRGQDPSCEHTITAANEMLLADMLQETPNSSTDPHEAGASHSIRIRREVQSLRSRDTSPEGMLRPPSRDIGEETRLRAQQVMDSERQRTREASLRSASQQSRVH